MKYKLFYAPYGEGYHRICFEGPATFCIYRSDLDPKYGVSHTDWPNGFWGDKKFTIDNTEYMRMREEYFAHQEEYIAEAKKLIIKEML